MRNVYYFCLKKTRNADEAESLASEITAAIVERLYAGDTPENFTAWVYAIARNRWSAWAKQRYDRRERFTDTALDELDIASGSDVEAGAEYREQLAILRRELAFVAREYREIVIAYYIEDRSVADIAKSLGIPVGTVKWKLYESRKHLKEGMKMSREFGPRSYKPEEIRFVGAASPKGSPPTGAVERKIPKNLVLEASDNPSTAEELAIALGIALPYIEEEIELLIRADLMKKVGDKYVTNFYIADVETQNKIYAMLEENTAERNASVRKIALDLLPTLRATATIPDGFIDSDLLWYLLPQIPERVRTVGTEEKWYGFDFPHPDGSSWFILGFEENTSRKFLPETPVIDGVSGTIYDFAEGKRICFNKFPFNNINRDEREILQTINDKRWETLAGQIIVFANGSAEDFYAKMAAHPLFQTLIEQHRAHFERAADIISLTVSGALRDQFDFVAGSLVSAAQNLIALPVVKSAYDDGVLTDPEPGHRVAMWMELR
jgi:RNA polymerase sigma factor (sigma-70 family)